MKKDKGTVVSVTIETVLSHTLTHLHKQLCVQKLTAVGVIGHSDDAHWLLRNISTQHLHFSSCVFVSPKHGPPHPVRPEDVVPVHSQAKRMHRLILQHHLQGAAQPQTPSHSVRKFQHCIKLLTVIRKPNNTIVLQSKYFLFITRPDVHCVWVCYSHSAGCHHTRSALSCPVWHQRSKVFQHGGLWPGRSES